MKYKVKVEQIIDFNIIINETPLSNEKLIKYILISNLY